MVRDIHDFFSHVHVCMQCDIIFTKGCKLGVQMAGVKLMLDHITGVLW